MDYSVGEFIDEDDLLNENIEFDKRGVPRPKRHRDYKKNNKKKSKGKEFLPYGELPYGESFDGLKENIGKNKKKNFKKFNKDKNDFNKDKPANKKNNNYKNNARPYKSENWVDNTDNDTLPDFI